MIRVLSLLLTAWLVLVCLYGKSFATPAQDVLFGRVKPTISTNFLGGALDPANYSYSGPSLRTITDATGAITYAPTYLSNIGNIA